MPAQPSPTPPRRRTGVLERRAMKWIIDDLAKGTIAHKYQIFDAICVAKDRLGLKNGTIAVLRALISFHPNVTLQAGEPLVIHPSNKLLQARANGMAEATLRRHLATLLSAGIIARRDSPNRKRYVRQGADEAQTYGFDLSLLVARAPEFEALKNAVEAEARERRRLLDLVTIYRRDLRETIAEALALDFLGDWEGIMAAFAGLSHERADRLGSDRLRALVEALDQLGRVVDDTLKRSASTSDSNGDGAQNERHHPESKPEPIDSEPHFRTRRAGEVEPPSEINQAPQPGYAGRKRDTSRPLSFRFVVNTLPAIKDYTRTGQIEDTTEFLAAAELARSSLGISPDAWREAIDVMGRFEAAVATAFILDRVDTIRSPGGYLRALTDKAGMGGYSPWALVLSTLKRKTGGAPPMRRVRK